MTEETVIVGAGGHGRVCLDICLLADIPVRGFLDNSRETGEKIHGVPVLGGDELISDSDFRNAAQFIIGIGDRQIRPRVIAELDLHQATLTTLVHPSAVISPRCDIEDGTLVNAGAVINIDTRIGRHCVINTNCSIDHDCVIGENVHICPGATLAGGIICADDSFIGSGAAILPNCQIGHNATVGGGTIVISDIPENSTFVGAAGRTVTNVT